MDKKIVIIGAGPTGLGAAYRLSELGHTNYHVFEKENYVGGLAASFKDNKGFTWDVGGHVIHSHFKYFDKVLNQNLKNNKHTLSRKSFIFFRNKLVPYPFQNHLHYLPLKNFLECLLEIIKLPKNKKAKNFQDYINKSMGKGIGRYFMVPYNRKVWAYPLSRMGTGWITERVSSISPTSVLKSLFLNNSKNWGPNNRFIYPKFGTGSLWKEIGKKLGVKSITLKKTVRAIDTQKKLVILENGQKIKYDWLISTIPLDQLIKSLLNKPKNIDAASKNLIHNSVSFYGFGIKNLKKTNTSWVYYPQKNVSFYRATFLSNYSKHLTPQKNLSSILVEISSQKELSTQKVTGDLIKAKIIKTADLPNIVDIWKTKAPYAYPIPTINRDKYLKIIQEYLMSKSIFSRGRFGAWKYEISNMDYSFMQGVEIVDKIISSKEETIWHL